MPMTLNCTQRSNPTESGNAMKRLENCVKDIRQWMIAHFLRLNDSKTEFMIFGTPCDIKKVTEWTVPVGDTEILPSATVRNIGAYLDTRMTMADHVNSIIRSCY